MVSSGLNNSPLWTRNFIATSLASATRNPYHWLISIENLIIVMIAHWYHLTIWKVTMNFGSHMCFWTASRQTFRLRNYLTMSLIFRTPRSAPHFTTQPHVQPNTEWLQWDQRSDQAIENARYTTPHISCNLDGIQNKVESSMIWTTTCGMHLLQLVTWDV